MKILIIGAGPAGIGAAMALQEIGFEDWQILEMEDAPGGLSRSVADADGFTWDLGGHVQFSHYGTFDRAMTAALGPDGWLHHARESWVRSCGTWVPYPFQNNIHRLPKAEQLRCVQGLIDAAATSTRAWPNFKEMIYGTFGEGLAELFMAPYNTKVWAYPPETLGTGWIGERVAVPDLKKILEGIILDRDNVSWGPNNTFRFPKRGGTGAIWTALAAALPATKIRYGCRVAGVDLNQRALLTATGERFGYDALISTMPLDLLAAACGLERANTLAAGLKYSSTHVIGVALRGRPDPEIETKCWMYFPEANCPFYRVTVFSNYSPANVPDAAQYWSLMAEVSESPAKPVDGGRVIEETIEGLIATGLIGGREAIHHTWSTRLERSYPTPSTGRENILNELLPLFENHNIFSRGRFGAWRYEVGNQDHSFMQGVEAARRIVRGTPELTLWFPDLVNAMHPVYGKEWL